MFKLVLALPLSLQLVSIADGVPKLDVTASCKGAARAVVRAESEKREKACYETEKAAQDKLGQSWSKFPANDRNFCLTAIKGYAPTYTELAICLEMARDVRQIGEKPEEAVPDKSTPNIPKASRR
jgi:hypothetical protein